MKQISHWTLLLFFLCVFLLSGSQPTFAQTEPSLDVTVSPSSFDLSNKPGDTITNKIRLRNNTDSPLTLAIEVQKLGPNKQGELVIQEMTSEDAFLSWIKIDKKITAPSKEWTVIPFTITVPKDAAFGYYYAIALKKDASDTGGNIAKVTGSAAIPILLNVKKDGAQFAARIVEFGPSSFINEYLPTTFTTVVQNEGNVHIRPHGNIFIRSFGQKDLDVLDVNPGLGAILPQAKRRYESTWNNSFIVKKPVLKENGDAELNSKGKPVTKISINWNKLTDFRFGRYTATVVLIYDNGVRDETLQQATTFGIIPYTPIAIVLGGFIALIVILRTWIRWYIRRQMQRMRR